MPERSVLRLLLPTLLLTVLWGCDGPGSDPPSPEALAAAAAENGTDTDTDADADASTQEILVSPSLGKVIGAGARAFDVQGTALSDQVITGVDGRARLLIPEAHTGPVIVTLTGQDGATYYDEASGQNEAFPGTDSFRAALPAPRATTGVSILTELALRLAEAGGTALDATSIASANERIRASLVPEIGDLLTPPTLVDSGTESNDLDDSDAGRMAARLGGLVRLALGSGTPALTILRQLAPDAADGIIDGRDSAGNEITTVYVPASFAADFVRAVQVFAEDFGAEPLQQSVADARASASFPAASTGGDGSGGGDGSDGSDTGDGGTAGPGDVRTPVTVSADLAGAIDRFYIDLSATNSADPFQNEESVTLTLGADSSLTVAGRTLTAPFRRDNDFEAIWRDDAGGLEWRFLLSSPTTINSITVHDVSDPGAVAIPANELGRFVVDLVPAGVELIAEFAGTFDAVVVDACSQAPCPDDTALGGTVSVGIDAEGVVTFGALVIDPSTPGTEIVDERAFPAPALFFSVPTADGVFGVSLRIDENVVAPESRVRGVRLSKRIERQESLTVEVVETRAAYTTYFDDFLAATTPPVEMIFVQADASPPFGRAITSAPEGIPTLCRSFELTAQRAPTTEPGATADLRPQFVWLAGDRRVGSFLQEGSRLTTNSAGERLMSVFSGQRFVLAANHVRVEWGRSETVSTSEITLATVQDIASSRPADIDAACADFVSIGGTLTLDQPGTLTLVIGNLGDLTEIYRRDFDFASAGSITWEELLPIGLEYELVPTSSGLVCETGNGVGTLTETVADANVSCTAPDPE